MSKELESWKERVKKAEVEYLEQARLNGTGSEREAKLMAECDRYKKHIADLKFNIYQAKNCNLKGYNSFIEKDIKEILDKALQLTPEISYERLDLLERVYLGLKELVDCSEPIKGIIEGIFSRVLKRLDELEK